MSQADRIRRFVLENHIGPARERGLKHLTVRAGDIHSDMGLRNRLPLVCSALGGRKLAEQGGIVLRNRQGPAQGANVYFSFELAGRHQEAARPAVEAIAASQPGSRRLRIDPDRSLVLVSCVKSKLPRPAPARELYISPLFTGRRALAEASRAPWYVLSAKYGLVRPDEVIAPYDYTLNRLGVAARREWAEHVLRDLLPLTSGREQVIFLAGARYREFLVGPLERRGLEVLVPMRGLKFGEQLSWLAKIT